MKDSKLTLYGLLAAGVLLLLVTLYKHPSFRPMFHFTTQQTWSKFLVEMQKGATNEAQEIWEFREFFDRGTIYLSKYQALEIPSKISDVYTFNQDFSPHTIFISGKIKSVEGTVPQDTEVFIEENPFVEIGWQERHKSEYVQIMINRTETLGLIIAQFPIELAQTANGYLHFDLRDVELVKQFENKKWVVISVVEI